VYKNRQTCLHLCNVDKFLLIKRNFSKERIKWQMYALEKEENHTNINLK